MLKMTWGNMPLYEDYLIAFEQETSDGIYRIRNCPRVGDVDLTAGALWQCLLDAMDEWEAGDDDAGSWCSDILYTLGFEWV